ncbi:hypothetical protein H5410_045362 [Solanum commersonii]|uniref:Uncharacterized protein n=1 Tax=Solanum commersonii TaxID=4109 RepID=A0A9J5XDG9_SOLCO|nr:hypothetical protein H5410_045362 [Solanum commersonii]
MDGSRRIEMNCPSAMRHKRGKPNWIATHWKADPLGSTTIKKTRPSCARVKVLVDLKGKFPNSVQMNIENSKTWKIRSNMIKIQYDYESKYCFESKMQGHNKDKCKTGQMPRRKEEQTKQVEHNIHHQEQPPLLQKGNARILSSGKVVGDPGNWNVVKDRRGSPVKINAHITEVAVSADSTQIEIPQSPNEVLHEILIHKESEGEQMQINDNESEVADDHIYSESNFSPKSTKVMKSERKGRKHGSGDSNQNIRIQPKRQVTNKQQYSL